MNKRAVYTAIIGGYDLPRDPTKKTPGWDYILFTDNRSIKSNVWDVKYVDKPDHLTSVKFARMIKIKCGYYLSNHNMTVWVDGNIQINCNMDIFVEKYLPYGYDMAIMSHPNRICIYQEAIACVRRKKDSFKTVQRQINYYKEKGYPKNKGMVATGIIIRKHKTIVLSFMDIWSAHVKNRSHRDQLSFNYVHHMHFKNVNMNIFPWDFAFSGPFIKYKHPKKRLW